MPPAFGVAAGFGSAFAFPAGCAFDFTSALGVAEAFAGFGAVFALAAVSGGVLGLAGTINLNGGEKQRSKEVPTCIALRSFRLGNFKKNC